MKTCMRPGVAECRAARTNCVRGCQNATALWAVRRLADYDTPQDEQDVPTHEVGETEEKREGETPRMEGKGERGGRPPQFTPLLPRSPALPRLTPPM